MATLQLDMFTTLALPTHDHAETYIGTCGQCKRTSRTTAEHVTAYGSQRFAHCPHGCTYTAPGMNRHGKRVSIEYKRIQGTYNPRIRCGAKCQTATGPTCECSCEGRNHGGRA
jgi:hypothetical protein